MTENTPDFRPYERSAKVLGYLIDDNENIGFGLDDVEVESLRTGIIATKLVPELYEALDALIPLAAEAHCGGPDTAVLLTVAKAALAKARGES